jgi:hypothetical protein
MHHVSPVILPSAVCGEGDSTAGYISTLCPDLLLDLALDTQVLVQGISVLRLIQNDDAIEVM